MARITIFLFGVFLINFQGFAQLELATNTHDFGVLRRADQNWVDIPIKNTGSKDEVLFRLEGPASVQVKMSSKIVKPDSTVMLRIQHNPVQEGNFKVDLKLFASAWQSPKALQLNGVSTYASNGGIPCPDFSDTPGNGERMMHISVRDVNRNEPIENALITVYSNGRKVEEIYSDQNGEVSKDLPLGRYYFAISALGAVTDTALYVNAVNDHLLVKLDANTMTTTPPARPVTPSVKTVEPEIVENKTPAIPAAPPAPVEELENGMLSLRLYKESNIVFLVDVSTSMRHQSRLDLLKIAMIDLLDVMRPQDRFTLISYATSTDLILETHQNLDKEACARAINSLEAKGSTAGAKAIDEAGRHAEKHFIESGNNQIILATDGSFNEGNDKALKLASRYNRKGIHTSVLGIKCGKYTTEAMMALSDEGGGRFIAVDAASDAGTQLISEIKVSARK